ncbi:DUF192 domain-containing protein [Alloacidobacterium sp.]|uniref:DUF192 domain-containing protein n=1 Tax=Alloacidobacterium sp. TaxID=2951999 RepID=UPI002D63E239|nr:DUF192 domain-containing protein [Alloacidobacterium sp.]HYK37615.1 DUF192 domain-containing protein [Alloacidobacterium sp.]
MTRISQWVRRLGRGGESKPDLRLKVSNLTRQSVLAGCLQVADDGEKRRKGLLGRDCLSAEEGLWILPCEAVHTFGMRFPIDLIYLDRHNRVKKTRSNVVPFRLSACLSAHSVIELPTGTVSRTQTQAGDQLEFCAAELSTDRDFAEILSADKHIANWIRRKC